MSGVYYYLLILHHAQVLFTFLVMADAAFCNSIVVVEVVIVEKVRLYQSEIKHSREDCPQINPTLIDFKYIRTSSNCFRRKKHIAMHCRPGIVSQWLADAPTS